MASPPFNIAETTPGDSDIVSQFPAAERTFRDIVEDWIRVEHGTSGHHTLPSLTTTERDAITNWEIGALIYNETTKQLQFTTAIDSDVWYSEGVPTGTRAPFQQTAAPTGWTKESNAAYEDAVMTCTTGTVGTAGTVAASTLFARTATDAVTLVAGNIPSLTSGNFGFTASLPNHVHSISLTTSSNGAHTHTYRRGDLNETGTANGGNAVTDGDTETATSSDGAHTHTVSGNSGNPTTNPSISATITYTNGSQSTFSPAIDMRVKRFSCIIATKD